MDNNGIKYLSTENNFNYIYQHFSNIFSQEEEKSNIQASSIQKIEEATTKTISQTQSSILDEKISSKEILNAILSLKNRKSPRNDGLNVEVFKEFKDVLVAPLLLAIWEEGVKYQALPFTINSGIIKLIHKKGPKDQNNN